MDWVLVAGYIVLSVATLVIVAREWHRQQSELSGLRERVVKLETELVKLRKPSKRVAKPPVSHQQAGGVWRYSGRGW